MATLSLTVKNPDEVLHTTNASLLPLPENLGIEDCPSIDRLPRMALVDHVGATNEVAAVFMSSEYVRLISTPPGAKAVDVKFDQLSITRPVSGSRPMNSLSAASRAFAPEVRPCGFVHAGMMNGPFHV